MLVHELPGGVLLGGLDGRRDLSMVVVDRPVKPLAEPRARGRCWSTAKTGSAAIESSVLQLASITVEWKSALWTNCSWVPRRSGWPGIAAQTLEVLVAATQRGELAAGTSSSARTEQLLQRHIGRRRHQAEA